MMRTVTQRITAAALAVGLMLSGGTGALTIQAQIVPENNAVRASYNDAVYRQVQYSFASQPQDGVVDNQAGDWYDGRVQGAQWSDGAM